MSYVMFQMLEWLQNIVFLALGAYFLHVFDLGLVMRLFFLNKGPMKLYLIHQKVNSLLFRLVQILHNLPQIPTKAKFLQRWLQVYIIKKNYTRDKPHSNCYIPWKPKETHEGYSYSWLVQHSWVSSYTGIFL